jgi:hypothetical protein
MLGLSARETGVGIGVEPGFGGVPAMRRQVPVVSSTSHLTGRCTNDLFCHEAIRKADVVVAPGSPFVCPACQKPLKARDWATRRGQSVRAGHGKVPLLNEGALLKGRCDNTRRCDVARERQAVFVRVGNVFVCPKCSKPLSMATDKRPAPAWVRPASVCAAAAIVYLSTPSVFGWTTHATPVKPAVVDVKPAVPAVVPAPTETANAAARIAPAPHKALVHRGAPRQGRGTLHHSAAMAA